MSYTNSDSLILFSPILVPFISFSCPTAMARTSNSMINKSGESGNL